MPFVFAILFAFSSQLLVAQSSLNEPKCLHIPKQSKPSPLIKYLFEKYGVEETESILLNKSYFESINQVTILFGVDYDFAIQQLNQFIADEQDIVLINELNIKKSRLINFSDIEHLLIK